MPGKAPPSPPLGKPFTSDDTSGRRQPASPTMIAVDAAALRELLEALDDAGHLIRELQATRKLHLLGHSNPIEILLEQLRASAPASPPEPARELARREALHAAVAALYFDDSSDFRTALGAVVRHLEPRLARRLLALPKRAYVESLAALDAARSQVHG